MQIVNKNLAQKELVLNVDSPDDLWVLEQIIEVGDVVSGKTERKIKIGGDEDRKPKVVRKDVFLKIEVITVESHEYSSDLRVGGHVLEGPEDVPRGSHHTLNVSPGTTISIVKKEWPVHQLSKIEEACRAQAKRLMVLIFDREEAIFALMKNKGFEVVSKIKGDVAKKGSDESAKGNFYADLGKALLEYDQRFNLDTIIVASPSFWKEYLVKEIPQEIKGKVVVSSCSEVSESAFSEVMQKPELFRVMEKDNLARETMIMEELLKAISKGMACYGYDDCKEKMDMGAVEKLLVSYTYLNKARLDGTRKRIENLMKTAENRGGQVHIISTDDADKKLSGLGGIGGVLRWQIS